MTRSSLERGSGLVRSIQRSFVLRRKDPEQNSCHFLMVPACDGLRDWILAEKVRNGVLGAGAVSGGGGGDFSSPGGNSQIIHVDLDFLQSSAIELGAGEVLLVHVQ